MEKARRCWWRRRKSGDDGGQEPKLEEDSDSSATSDSEYDKEYEDRYVLSTKTRGLTRHRDFARKYAWSTFDLLHHALGTITAAEMLEDGPVIPSLLARVSLDDLWQLLAEMRLQLDHIDGDLGADLHLHLLESVGTKTRNNVAWMRSSLREIHGGHPTWRARIGWYAPRKICSRS